MPIIQASILSNKNSTLYFSLYFQSLPDIAFEPRTAFNTGAKNKIDITIYTSISEILDVNEIITPCRKSPPVASVAKPIIDSVMPTFPGTIVTRLMPW